MQVPYPYRDESSDPKINAQRNLTNRTHYVDDDTLRYHKSRVISARVHDSGLLFSIITRDALDYQNTKRGFRYVIFDLFGHVIERPVLENAFSTSAKASKALYDALDKIDAITMMRDAIERERQHFDREIARLTRDVESIAAKSAA